jgi:hypothetical protein
MVCLNYVLSVVMRSQDIEVALPVGEAVLSRAGAPSEALPEEYPALKALQERLLTRRFPQADLWCGKGLSLS